MVEDLDAPSSGAPPGLVSVVHQIRIRPQFPLFIPAHGETHGFELLVTFWLVAQPVFAHIALGPLQSLSSLRFILVI